MELLLKIGKCVAQRLGLCGLIFELLRETCSKLLTAQTSLQSGASQIVLLLLHGEFGFAVPLVHGVLMFFEFLLQKMLVGDRDGDLRLDLQELVFHVEDKLLGQLLRILGLSR